MHSRFLWTGQLQVLEEEIELDRKALALRPPGYPDCSYSLSCLADDLHSRFLQTRQLQDLEKAIEYQREALSISPAKSPLRITCLADLSRALLVRFQTMSREADLNEAFDTFVVATENRFDGVREQLSTAQSWVRSAREFRHSSLLAAYVKSLALLQRGLIISPSLELQWVSLTRYSSLLSR